MNKLFTLTLFLISSMLVAQDFSKLKVWLDPISESLLQQKGIEMDHGVIKKGVFLISDFHSETRDWMDRSGIQYDVIHEDVQAYYLQRGESFSRSSRNGCISTSNDTFQVPDNFVLGSMGGFYTYDEFLQQLDSMHQLYPSLITVRQPIDTFLSHQNRPIYHVKISENAAVNENEPEALYTAIHHAREPQSLTQLIFYMWYLLENYGSINEVTQLLDQTELYFIPMINPDGYIRNETTNPNGGGMWRKNLRNNGDGTEGVDLNRNYGYEWGIDNQGSSPSTSAQTYRGPAPFSEPETQAVKWFCEQHDFGLALNYHSFGNYLIYPWGTGTELTPDSNVFIAMAEALTAQNNYLFGTGVQTVGYSVNGDSDDWMYGEQTTKSKMFSMTPEVGKGDDGFWPVVSRITPLSQENVLPNLLLAHFAGNYAIIEDASSAFISTIQGSYSAKATRLGLAFDGSYTFSFQPVSGNIVSGTQSQNVAVMNLAEELVLSFNYELDPTIQEGDDIVFDLVAEFNGKTFKQRVTKQFGDPFVALSNGGKLDPEFLSQTDWGLTNQDFVSPDVSITDSPYSLYSPEANNELIYNRIIDLRQADLAYLNFDAKWFIESGWDYAQVLVSPVSEEMWTPMCGLYSKEGNSYQDEGQPVWDGIQTNWVEEAIDLSDFLGERVKVKFLLVSDQFVELDGMYIDDLEVVMLGAHGVDSGYVDTIGTTEDTTTGVKNLNRQSFVVFPNPADKSLIIQQSSERQLHIQVYDMAGRMLEEQKTMNGKLDTSALPNGVYLIRISDERSTETHRISVLH